MLSAAPLAHTVAVTTKENFDYWQPFSGGARFVLCQLIGWLLYTVSCFSAVNFVYTVAVLKSEPMRYHLFITGVCGFFSQVFVVWSLRYFHREGGQGGNLTRTKRWGTVVTLSLCMATFACALFCALEWRHDSHEMPYTLPPVLLAACALFLAPPLTHGVAGPSKQPEGYEFYQPGRGGAVFVAMQAVAWCLYGVCALLGVFKLYTMITERHSWGYGVAAAMGGAGLLAQVLVSTSLFLYRAPAPDTSGTLKNGRTKKIEEKPSVPWDQRLRELFLDVRAYSTIFLFYQLPIDATLLMFSMAAVGRQYWLVTLVGFLAVVVGRDFLFFMMEIIMVFLGSEEPILYVVAVGLLLYWTTYLFDPHITGARRMPRFQRAHFWADLQRYFTKMAVNEPKQLVAGADLDPKATYIYGFHPHGVYPLTSVWIGLCPAWKNRYPGVEYDCVAATVVFRVPIVREFGMWAGGRDASRRSIMHALSRGRSVLLTPGGQAEMREHTDDPNCVVLVTRHKGFLRIALETGLPLVPMFSFGENQVMSNVHAPTLQKWFCKHFSFGFPHFPHGPYYLPVPRQYPINVVIGDPLPVQKVDEASDEDIARLHDRYYGALRALFDKYKAEYGYRDAQLVYKDE